MANSQDLLGFMQLPNCRTFFVLVQVTMKTEENISNTAIPQLTPLKFLKLTISFKYHFAAFPEVHFNASKAYWKAKYHSIFLSLHTLPYYVTSFYTAFSG